MGIGVGVEVSVGVAVGVGVCVGMAVGAEVTRGGGAENTMFETARTAAGGVCAGAAVGVSTSLTAAPGGESAHAATAKTQNASATIRKMDEDMAGEFYHKARLTG